MLGGGGGGGGVCQTLKINPQPWTSTPKAFVGFHPPWPDASAFLSPWSPSPSHHPTCFPFLELGMSIPSLPPPLRGPFSWVSWIKVIITIIAATPLGIRPQLHDGACAQPATCLSSKNPPGNPMGNVQFTEDRGSERLSNWPGVTQPGNGIDGI